MPRREATGFGVMQVDAADRITEFLEKPADPPGLPGNPEVALASIVGGLFKERAVGGRAIERRNERHRKSTEVRHYLD